MAKGQYVSDLRPGDYVDTTVIVKEKKRYPYRNRAGFFLGLILKDRTGSIEGRVWDNAEQVDREVEVKDVVRVRGIVEIYQQNPQVRVASIEKLSEGQYDRTDLVPYTEKDPDALFEKLTSSVESVQNEYLKTLLNRFFENQEFVRAFREAPATYAGHHAWLGGLMEHTVSLLALAESALVQYPQIDRDLLITGILLHDVGRVREFVWDIDWETTDEGRLLGHSVLGDEMICREIEKISDFPKELAMRVRHMVISHFGTGEWGVPKVPMTLEAAALSYLDRLDARMNQMQQLVGEGEGGWTGYIRALRRRMYLGAVVPEAALPAEEVTSPEIELPLTEWDFGYWLEEKEAAE